MRRNVRSARKHLAGRCTFCPETAMEALDAHRLVPGAEGGTYAWANVLVLCASCHRKVHAGAIVIEGRRPTSAGRYVILARVDGAEAVYPEPVFGC
jgi:5-methylcytosine-specific restriction endonuclease McrA